jgi:Flp pilus assembly protein protease CpaA
MYTILMTAFCVGIALVDFKTYRIPDVLLASFVLALSIADRSLLLANVTIRLNTALAVFLLFAAVWYFSQGMGLGDVKYATVLGYLLGPDKIIQALLYTAFLSIIIYVMGIFLFRWTKTTKIPFAPFLSAGVILSIL